MGPCTWTWTIAVALVVAGLISPISGFIDAKAGRPAVTMDYKMHVEGGKEECVYQYTDPGSNFIVDFSVIRGGDGYASFMVRSPDGVVVLPYEWKKRANYETNNTMGGYYSICIDNQFSRFNSKVVSVYMAIYVAHEWDKYIKELEQADVDQRVFTRTFATISQKISMVLQHMYQSKNLEARDYALLTGMNYNIGFWSTVQCVIMIGSGILHVYIIRQLFRETPSGGGKFNAKL